MTPVEENAKTLPTFVGIGAQRAGTTWVHNCLAEHPQVFMCKPKELHFFYVHYHLGLDWYAQKFSGAGKALARGEITPDYLYHEEALRHIARDLPEARLFAVLRNPVERAISAFTLAQEKYGSMSFREACESDSALVSRGYYAQHLGRVLNYVAAERLKVMLYDDIQADPGSFLEDLYRYVGVEPSFRPKAMTVRYNRIMYPRLQRILLKSTLGWTIDVVKASPLGTWLRARHARIGRCIATERDRRDLTEHFSEDVQELSRILGRDLSHWLKVPESG